MFPVIFSIGPFSLRTMSVMMVVALLLSAFVFYRKVREEHFSEEEALDGFLLSVIVGGVAGRAAYVALNFSNFGWNIWQWFDVISRPGLVGSVAVAAAAWYLYAHAGRLMDDKFQLIDLWSMAAAAGLGVAWLGLLLDGSTYGIQTNLPVGITFPGLLEPHLPIQAFSVIFFLFLFWLLHWFEYRYRTITWYRSGKTSAQSGFLVSFTIIAVSLWYLVLTWLRAPVLVVYEVPLDAGMAVAGLLFGIGLLFVRSGRTFWIWK